MSTPIRTRLSLSFLLVLLIGMGVAAALAWLAVEQLFVDTQRENLLAQARLSASTLRGSPGSSTGSGGPLPGNLEPYSQTSNALPGIHTHLLGEQDAVVLALPLDADAVSQQMMYLENSRSISTTSLLARSELDSALKGTPATAIRRVSGRRVLYAAAPVYANDGTISGIVYLATPLPPSGLPLSAILRLVGALGIAILLALAAGALLARRISRPLEAVARAAQAVAGGNLEQSVPAASNIRELHSLGESFNAMTDSLRQSVQARNAFIADVTHELRTPLTVIKGTVETLEDGALDDAAGRGPLLASMQRETDRLIRLVNELLVLARADAGALKLDLQTLELGELARSRCETLAPLAHARNVILSVQADKPAKARGDADRLAQVLDNLLDNAIRHSSADASVTIHIRQAGEELQCSVSDTGSGIPNAHLPFIFERFYRADASRNRQTGGTGLGLAIVRALILAQSGRVAAESVEGAGTTITFWLPIAS